MLASRIMSTDCEITRASQNGGALFFLPQDILRDFVAAAAAFPIFACRKKTDLLDGGRIHRKYLYSTTGTLIYRLIRDTLLQRRTNNCIGETEQYGRKNMANLTVTISKQH